MKRVLGNEFQTVAKLNLTIPEDKMKAYFEERDRLDNESADPAENYNIKEKDQSLFEIDSVSQKKIEMSLTSLPKKINRYILVIKE